jgi:hypothetical protein
MWGVPPLDRRSERSRRWLAPSSLQAFSDCHRHWADPPSMHAPATLYGDDDLSSSVSQPEIGDRLRRLLQRVGPVDDRPHLPRFKESPQEDKVLIGRGAKKRACYLAHDCGQGKRLDDVAHTGMAGVRYQPALGREGSSAV